MEETVKGGSQYLRYGKTHYERNHDQYIQNNKERRKVLSAYLRKIKEDSGCADCGIKDFRVLDFDHVGEKTIVPARMSSNGWSLKRIDKELANCEVRCSNCHRIITYERRQAVVTQPGQSVTLPK